MDGWVDGWMDGWMDVKAVLRIAYSNKKFEYMGLALFYLKQDRFETCFKDCGKKLICQPPHCQIEK